MAHDKPGRYTPPKMIQPEDIIKRAKEAAKNPAVPAGTRRTDVKIAICRSCDRQKVVAATTGICTTCWVEKLDAEMAADELTREAEAIGEYE